MSKLTEGIVINLHKVCRICLLEQPKMISTALQVQVEGIVNTANNTLLDYINFVTNKTIRPDDLPQLICSACCCSLLDMYKFRLKFEQTHAILEQYLAQKTSRARVETIIIKDESNDHIPTTSPKMKTIETDTPPAPSIRCQKRKRTPSSDDTHNEPIKANNFVRREEFVIAKKRAILYPCPICTKEFTALDLREHIHSHTDLNKYLNIPRTRRIKSNTRFYCENIRRVGLNEQKKLIHKCFVCDARGSAEFFRLHVQSHENQLEYKCDRCQRVFKKMNHLNTHRIKHLKECPYKCEKCGKGFVIKSNYDCHILTHDADYELPHECTYCLKRFSNPEHLYRHLMIHTKNISYAVKYRVIKCYHCLKTFKDRTELKTHPCTPIEKATNIQYPCKVCGKIFQSYSGLYSHNRNVHNQNDTKVLCSACGNYVSNIYTHMLRHTGERPFECSQCDKKFFGKPQLRQHLLVHSGLKPFVCSICAKAFNNLYNLQVHERIHKGEKRHICTICKKAFLEKSYLKKHMTVHTKV